jgi:Xaa-Pro aminopeptidase
MSRTPVALSFVIAHADGTATCSSRPKRSRALVAHLGNAVRVQDRAAFVPALEAFGGKTVAVDPERAVAAVFHALEAARACSR